MLEKYRATIHGNTIEWDGDCPDGLSDDADIQVEVTVVNKPKKLPQSDGKKMADILGKIAARDGAKVFGDPLKWQCEIRKDRALPGRK